MYGRKLQILVVWALVVVTTACNLDETTSHPEDGDVGQAADVGSEDADGQKVVLALELQGEGAVHLSPLGMECGGDCQAEFEEGTEITLEAKAQEGNDFEEWSGACSGSTLVCTLTMEDDESVTAVFKSSSECDGQECESECDGQECESECDGQECEEDEPPPAEEECDPAPSDVQLMGPAPVVAVSETMESIGSEIASFEIPPRDGATRGRLETAVTSSNNAYRWTWVSRCPGGEPLDQTHDFFGELCQRGAYEVSVLRWVAPGHEDAYRWCEIAPDEDYYFNVLNGYAWDREPSESSCSESSCSFYTRYRVDEYE